MFWGFSLRSDLFVYFNLQQKVHYYYFFFYITEKEIMTWFRIFGFELANKKNKKTQTGTVHFKDTFFHTDFFCLFLIKQRLTVKSDKELFFEKQRPLIGSYILYDSTQWHLYIYCCLCWLCSIMKKRLLHTWMLSKILILKLYSKKHFKA